MHTSSIYFFYPGDLSTATGGYHYDRRLIQALRALGMSITTVALSERFPNPDAAALQQAAAALAEVPDQSVVIIDGLALGVMDTVVTPEAKRLQMIALCHHPLALEAGLSTAQQASLQQSEARALDCCRAVIVTSPHTGEILQRNFGVPAEKILTALPGTDAVPFAQCSGHPPRLLTVASLTRRKAHDVLIDALANISNLNWQAQFVGGSHFDPHWAEQLRAQVNRLGLNQRIEFAGDVADVSAAYQQADLFVLPSRFEGYGMVFAEALAAGLPVIAARAGAVPDVVPSDAGILVPVDDVAALAEALRKVLTNAELRSHLQAGARCAAGRLPAWRDSAQRVKALLTVMQQPI